MIDFAKELIEIKENHELAKKMAKANTIDLFDRCKDLIIFNIKKNHIQEKPIYFEDAMLKSLKEVVGDSVLNGWCYASEANKGIGDGLWCKTQFFAPMWFSERRLDPNLFLKLCSDHIEASGFKINVHDEIKGV
ncbi:hypothetical protein [Acinetobacter phage vB_AbaM_BP10]|nr:hypothetical protein [Acinetobacter phage vB_AbaM_BP10]